MPRLSTSLGRRLAIATIMFSRLLMRVAAQVTSSIGAAQPDAGMENVDGLLRGTDRALYRAKAEGRNRLAV